MKKKDIKSGIKKMGLENPKIVVKLILTYEEYAGDDIQYIARRIDNFIQWANIQYPETIKNKKLINQLFNNALIRKYILENGNKEIALAKEIICKK